MNKTTAVFLFACLLLASAVYLIKNEQDQSKLNEIKKLRQQKLKFRDPKSLLISNTHAEASKDRIKEMNDEMASLQAKLEEAEKNNDHMAATYRELLHQRRQLEMANPIDLPWKDFYRIAEGMKIDDNTMKTNILQKLRKQLKLSRQQTDQIGHLIDVERIDLIKAFQSTYGMERISGFKYGSTEEETKAAMDTLKKLRTTIRNKRADKYGALGLTPEQQKVVFAHLRNDHVISFTTDGYVGGGLGIPVSQLDKLGDKEKTAILKSIDGKDDHAGHHHSHDGHDHSGHSHD